MDYVRAYDMNKNSRYYDVIVIQFVKDLLKCLIKAVTE